MDFINLYNNAATYKKHIATTLKCTEKYIVMKFAEGIKYAKGNFQFAIVHIENVPVEPTTHKTTLRDTNFSAAILLLSSEPVCN